MDNADTPETISKKTPRFRRILCTAGITLAVLLTLGYLFMEKILLPAPHRYSERAGNVVIQSGNAELDAFFHPPADPGKPVILHSHGNGESLRYMFPSPRDYVRRGYGVLAYDYAGYGASTGKAGEKQACMDIAAAYDFLRNTKKIPPEKILPVGFSVGSGPSSFLAANYPVPGVVLCAPFASAVQVVLPFPLPGDRFPNATRLASKSVPLLLFHGKKDRIVPYRNGQAISRKAKGPVRFISHDRADHNDLFDILGETYWQELEAFSRRYCTDRN
ncbi:MAG: alpha/beta hydrolase [Lentisphaeria bacterium]|nr:alpha/beta hydrolase [Lentisphaeria bacterium]